MNIKKKKNVLAENKKFTAVFQKYNSPSLKENALPCSIKLSNISDEEGVYNCKELWVDINSSLGLSNHKFLHDDKIYFEATVYVSEKFTQKEKEEKAYNLKNQVYDKFLLCNISNIKIIRYSNYTIEREIHYSLNEYLFDKHNEMKILQILSYSDEELYSFLINCDLKSLKNLLDFLFENDLERILNIINKISYINNENNLFDLCSILLSKNVKLFEKNVYNIFQGVYSLDYKFKIGKKLVNHNPEKYKKEVLELALVVINEKCFLKDLKPVEWIIKYFPKEADLLIFKDKINQGLLLKDKELVEIYLNLAEIYGLHNFKDSLYDILKHSSKELRQKIIERIIQIENNLFDKAVELLSHKNGNVRCSAVSILSKLQTEDALIILEKHLERERLVDISNMIMSVLEPFRNIQNRNITKNDLQKIVNKAQGTIKVLPTKYLELNNLPSLYFKDGEKINSQTIKYMLYKQSKEKEIKPNIEVAPLYRMIDKKTSGEFAEYIFKKFIESGSSTKDKWILVLVGILGNDSIIDPLVNQIYKWFDVRRAKTAVYGVETLALIGTNKALIQVNRIKKANLGTNYVNISKAACKILIQSAKSLNITLKELIYQL